MAGKAKMSKLVWIAAVVAVGTLAIYTICYEIVVARNDATFRLKHSCISYEQHYSTAFRVPSNVCVESKM